MMIHACRQNNEAWIREFSEGFHKTHTAIPNTVFDECEREDSGRLYQIGRSVLARAEKALKQRNANPLGRSTISNAGKKRTKARKKRQ
jgi:hypothetical protein